MSAKLPFAIIDIARGEVGTEEVNGTNCGPRVNEYKAATTLPPAESWPWCAAFVCWVVWQAMKAVGIAETSGFKRPRTAGALDFIRWSLEQDGSTQTKRNPAAEDIRAGDIVVFQFQTGGHIGFAIEDGRHGHVLTVEGNTNTEGSREGGGVFTKMRSVETIKARIRFTV